MALPIKLDESRLNRREMAAAAQVAMRAFFDDPFFVFLSENEKLRERGLRIFFRAMLVHLGKGGRIVTARNEKDEIVGVAAWLPTECYPQSVPTQLAQIPGTIRALYRRPRSLVWGNQFLSAMAKNHPKELHWYLFLLVADPSVQRSGIGKSLLTHGLDEVDQEGVGSYLETQKFDNIAYYRRYGYELTGELRPIKNGPALYTMWRAPR